MATETNKPAKQPFTPIAGPYGHPVHPMLIPIPIGAWVASLIFDIGSHVAKQPGDLARGAYWLIGIGIVGALLAAVFGLLDLMTIPRGRNRTFRTALIHMTLNVATVVGFIINFFLRRADVTAGRPVGVGLIVFSVILLAALTVSGWLGGTMAYHYGVRVADERDQAPAYGDAASDFRAA